MLQLLRRTKNKVLKVETTKLPSNATVMEVPERGDPHIERIGVAHETFMGLKIQF